MDYLKDKDINAYCFLGDYTGEFPGIQQTMKMLYYLREKKQCFDLPEGTEDFRFRSENFGLAGRSAMALTLHGKEYDDFINDISQKYHNGSISGYLYNRELDYTGMKVSETINNYDDNGSYIGFPTEQIKYVIDDDIMDYTIIYYDYYDGAGASTKTIVTNSETGRIVFYSFGSN